MITPPSPRSVPDVAAAAPELTQGPISGGRPAAGSSRATYVPSEGPHSTVIGRALRSLLARAPRSTRSTRGVRRSRTSRTPTAGYASATSSARANGSLNASANGSLSFLKDPKLSIEEKLVRLLGVLNAKWEKEMQEKLDRIAAGEGAKVSGSSSKKKKGGLFGSLGGIIKSALGPAGIALEALKIPAVRGMLQKIGGPVLAAGATALGFPQLAPLLLTHGSKVVELAAGVASSLDGGSGGTTASSSGGTKAMSDSERQTLLMEIQRIQQKQQEMFGLVSNILKSNHDTRSAIIGNIR